MIDNPKIDQLSYTLRRYFVDDFQLRNVTALAPGGRVLDLGGNKEAKRGQFDIGKSGFDVIYLNSSLVKKPDVQADAALIPFRDDAFDAVVCAELLEHVFDPRTVLNEVYRVLKPEGMLMMTVPFQYPVHADPGDFARYTDQFLLKLLMAVGFRDVTIEWQGRFRCVFVDMIRGLAYERLMQGGYGRRLLRKVLDRVIGRLKTYAVSRDLQDQGWKSVYVRGATTGFGILARK